MQNVERSPQCSFEAKGWAGVVATPWSTLDMSRAPSNFHAPRLGTLAVLCGVGQSWQDSGQTGRDRAQPNRPKLKSKCEQCTYKRLLVVSMLLTSVVELWASCAHLFFQLKTSCPQLEYTHEKYEHNSTNIVSDIITIQSPIGASQTPYFKDSCDQMTKTEKQL